MNYREKIKNWSLGKKIWMTFLILVGIYIFYGAFISQEDNSLEMGLLGAWLVSISLTTFGRDKPTKINGEHYTADPFTDFQALDTELKFLQYKIPLEQIKKIAISSDGEHGVVSLPFNYQNGKVPVFYFELGFVNSMHRYVSTYLPDTEIID